MNTTLLTNDNPATLHDTKMASYSTVKIVEEVALPASILAGPRLNAEPLKLNVDTSSPSSSEGSISSDDVESIASILVDAIEELGDEELFKAGKYCTIYILRFITRPANRIPQLRMAAPLKSQPDTVHFSVLLDHRNSVRRSFTAERSQLRS